MAQTPKLLFKFKIPEVASLPQEHQQAILTECWESPPVQAAWTRFWVRPQQIPLIPVIIISVYFAITDRGLIVSLLFSMPLFFIGFFSLRAYYRRHLTAAIRQVAASRLSPESDQI